MIKFGLKLLCLSDRQIENNQIQKIRSIIKSKGLQKEANQQDRLLVGPNLSHIKVNSMRRYTCLNVKGWRWWGGHQDESRLVFSS